MIDFGILLQVLCFYNRTGTLIDRCGLDTQFFNSALLAYEYSLGGYFPLIFWSVAIASVYIRYRNAAMAGAVGCTIAVSSAVVIPTAAFPMITLMVATAIATTLYYIFRRVYRSGGN